MSINLASHYVQQFSTNVALLLQQKGSKLRECVTMGSYVGEAASPVDQVGAVAAQAVTTRFEAMNRVDAPVDRRWVFPQDYDLPQLVDTFDKLRLIADPQSVYSTNAMYAMGRAMDDVILTAFFADAKTGKANGTTTSFGTGLTSSTGYNVSVDVGGAASGLNVAKLREGRRSLMASEVDIENDPIYCAVKATQHDNLLGEVQVVSADFGWKDMPVLKEGRLERFLGINFKHCERLTTATDDQSGTSTQVPMWAKSGMHLGIWNEIQNSVGQREDLRGKPWQIYTTGTFGATRLEEAKIRRVWCR